MSITSEHDRVVDALRDSQGDMLHPEDFDLSPIGLAVRLLEHYKRRIHELETNSGGVTIAIHGESDDLVTLRCDTRGALCCQKCLEEQARLGEETA